MILPKELENDLIILQWRMETSFSLRMENLRIGAIDILELQVEECRPSIRRRSSRQRCMILSIILQKMAGITYNTI